MRVGFELESPKALKSKAYKGLKTDYFSASVILGLPRDTPISHPSCTGNNLDYFFLL